MFRAYVGRFIATYIILLLAILMVWAAAQSSTFEGRFDLSAVWGTFIGFFGSAGALLTILIVLAIGGLGWWLATNNHNVAVGVLVIVTLIGASIFWSLVPWEVTLAAFPAALLWLLVFNLVLTFAVVAVNAVRREHFTFGRRAVVNTTTTTP